ncbi:MAG: NAD-dependent deacylase [Bacteroidetes bacterium]|jgi:NAD-dependent deacetylase|nr:NAD-dependent deacylase [Bacteroidota bacterium]
MKRIVVLSGAGISAESGIKTFRDDDGLWRSHRFEDLATPEAWERNMQLVLDFYNERRKQLFEVEPNEGHRALVQLESHFHVDIVTQNVDDLHERAGSKNVLHLHGELKKVRSTKNPDLVYTLDQWELKKGDTCAEGAQLRPHIVWFGEAVPNISKAIPIARKADIMIVVGTSLQVYPAAGLLDYVPSSSPVFLVDPKAMASSYLTNVTYIKKTAVNGLPELVRELINAHSQ